MVYICTCSTEGLNILEIIKDKNVSEEIIFVDRDAKKWGDIYKEKKIISIYELAKTITKDDFVVVPEKYYDNIFEEQLMAVGITLENVFVCCGNDFVEASNFTFLDYLEFHTNDHCNLNCRGCSHFAPLVPSEVFTDINIFERDIKRLHKLIYSIKKIRIMGGEPLLSSNLIDFIIIVRNEYPRADIRIVTNGILLAKQNDAFWNVIINKKVKIDISVYPNLYNKIDEYVTLINNKGAELGDIGQVISFIPPLHNKHTVPIDNTKCCHCVNIHEGKISTCPMTFYGKYFNNYFGKEIPFESGNIDLYNISNGKVLMKRLNETFELCKFCNNYLLNERTAKNPLDWRPMLHNSVYKISDWCEDI